MRTPVLDKFMFPCGCAVQDETAASTVTLKRESEKAAIPAKAALRPRGRSGARPHSARLPPSAGELTRTEAWEELQRRGANIATLPFAGKRRTGASFGPIRLERLENDQLTEIETWSDQRSGDALIEALRAPIVARFASFLGQPPIRATLTWTLLDRRITITGKRGDQPLEELIS